MGLAGEYRAVLVENLMLGFLLSICTYFLQLNGSTSGFDCLLGDGEFFLYNLTSGRISAYTFELSCLGLGQKTSTAWAPLRVTPVLESEV